MTHVLPSWVHLSEDPGKLVYSDWTPELVPRNNDVVKIARTNNLNIVPVLSNAQNGTFYGARVHRFLRDLAAQQIVIAELRGWLLRNHFQGINVDFENM